MSLIKMKSDFINPAPPQEFVIVLENYFVSDISI